MRSAVATLHLSELSVIHAVKDSCPLSLKARAIAARDLFEEVLCLRRKPGRDRCATLVLAQSVHVD